MGPPASAAGSPQPQPFGGCFNLVDLGTDCWCSHPLLPLELPRLAMGLVIPPSLGHPGVQPLHCAQESSQVDAICSFPSTLSNTCMQGPLGGCHPPPCPGTFLCYLFRSRRPHAHLQPTKVAPSEGVPHHTSVCKLGGSKVGVPGLSPVGVPWKPHFGCGNGAGKGSGSFFFFHLLLSLPLPQDPG